MEWILAIVVITLSVGAALGFRWLIGEMIKGGKPEDHTPPTPNEVAAEVVAIMTRDSAEPF